MTRSDEAYLTRLVFFNSMCDAEVSQSTTYYVPSVSDKKLATFVALIVQDLISSLLIEFDQLLPKMRAERIAWRPQFVANNFPASMEASKTVQTGRVSKLIGDLYMIIGDFEKAKFTYAHALNSMKASEDAIWACGASEGLLKCELALHNHSTTHDTQLTIKKFFERIDEVCEGYRRQNMKLAAYLFFIESGHVYRVVEGEWSFLSRLSLHHRYIHGLSLVQTLLATVEVGTQLQLCGCTRKKMVNDFSLSQAIIGDGCVGKGYKGLKRMVESKTGKFWSRIDNKLLRAALFAADQLPSKSDYTMLTLQLLFSCSSFLTGSQQHDLINEISKRQCDNEAQATPSLTLIARIVGNVLLTTPLLAPKTLKSGRGLFIVSSLKSQKCNVPIVAEDEPADIVIQMNNSLKRSLYIEELHLVYFFFSSN